MNQYDDMPMPTQERRSSVEERRPMPRVLGGSQGGGRFLMGEVPLAQERRPSVEERRSSITSNTSSVGGGGAHKDLISQHDDMAIPTQ